MLYGSEYIISLSHRENIYCNHSAFLLIISIRGSRGTENAQESSQVWSFLRLSLFTALFYFLFLFILFSTSSNEENGGLNLSPWDFGSLKLSCSLLEILYSITLSPKWTDFFLHNSLKDSDSLHQRFAQVSWNIL